MESAPVANLLAKRDTIRCYSNGRCYRTSSWDDWGRWVALAVIVFVVLLAAFLFSCINNRRRRRRGAAPMYGTAWLPTPGPKPPQQNTYYPNQPYNGGAVPPYSPPTGPVGSHPTGTTFNSNDGYYGHNNYGQNPYGGQQSGIELQPPQNAYQPYGQVQRGGEYVYEAPQGAPPGKGDGIIR